MAKGRKGGRREGKIENERGIKGVDRKDGK